MQQIQNPSRGLEVQQIQNNCRGLEVSKTPSSSNTRMTRGSVSSSSKANQLRMVSSLLETPNLVLVDKEGTTTLVRKV